jgi:hypothetical protein
MSRTGIAISVALLLGLLHGSGRAAEPFEGEVVLNWTKPYPVVIRYFLRGKKLRSEVEGSKELMTLADLDKLEVVHFVGKSYKVSKLPAPTADKGSYEAPVKSGKKKVVAGQSCEEWVQKDASMTTRYWVIPGLPSSVHPWSGSPEGSTAFEFLRSKDLFPLGLTWEQTKTGEISSQAEATVFKKKKVDPSVFAMPEGLKKLGP